MSQGLLSQRRLGLGLVGVLCGMLGARFVLRPTSTPRTSDVDAVWAMEDTYWRYVKAGDVENYRTLWDDGFRGWPCHTEHPSAKDSIDTWVREIRDGKITFDYNLTREGASNVGGAVVVFYKTPMIWKYADGRVDGRTELWRKFTHTWLKVNGKWQIIGGMCGADAPRS